MPYYPMCVYIRSENETKPRDKWGLAIVGQMNS